MNLTFLYISSFALNELAFQSLPRGLRRRAASHNLNRLPARLRAKAAREVNDSNMMYSITNTHINTRPIAQHQILH